MTQANQVPAPPCALAPPPTSPASRRGPGVDLNSAIGGQPETFLPPFRRSGTPCLTTNATQDAPPIPDPPDTQPTPTEPPDTQPLAALSTLRTTKPADFFRRVAELGAQAAEALDHAHQMGIVHRDIKPSNLLLDHRGKLWVTDFGLAQIESDASLTQTGDLLGTLRYMSPEQAEGKSAILDHRTDIYSLGITLYELTTRRPAFPHPDRQALLHQILTSDPPSPRSIDKNIPRDLETILLKAASKDPADRYPSAASLAADLRRFTAQEPIAARPLNPWQRARRLVRRRPAAAITVVVILLFVVAGLSLVSLVIDGERNAAIAAQKEEAAARREADRQRALAEENYRTARRAVERALKQIADENLNQNRELRDVRRKLLTDALEFFDVLLTAAPNDARTFFQRGEVHELLHNGENAVSDFLKAIELDPNYLEPHHHLAHLYAYGLGPFQANTSAMLDHARQAYKLDPRHPRSLYCYARALAFDGQNEEARKLLQLFRELSPESAETYHQLAGAYSELDDDALALTCARRAVQLDPNNPDAHSRLGTILDNDDPVAALKEFDEALRLRPYGYSKWGNAYLHRRGDCLLDLGRHAEALEAYNLALEIGGPTTPCLKRRATAYFKLQQYDKSLADLRAAINLGSPVHAWILIFKEREIADCPDQTYRDGVLALLDDAVGKNPEFFVGRAVLYAEMGRFAEAKTDLSQFRPNLANSTKQEFENAVSLQAYGLRRVGKALNQANRSVEAEPLLRECLNIYEQHQPHTIQRYTAMSLLGDSLARQQKFTDAGPLLVQAHAGTQQHKEGIDATVHERLLNESADRLSRFQDAVKRSQTTPAGMPIPVESPPPAVTPALPPAQVPTVLPPSAPNSPPASDFPPPIRPPRPPLPRPGLP